jgi:hypothetical protein
MYDCTIEGFGQVLRAMALASFVGAIVAACFAIWKMFK